ncbi:MAG: NupC/NupG family nucleoside CNT transporter [Pseudomonadales bacterium]|nr:NupC/NupG family nucleoside CNT transporter [Pseudomonadales bacterium]
MGLLGIAAILGIAYALSDNRKAIEYRIVGSAFLLQIGVALFVMHSAVGQSLIQGMSYGVQSILEYANAGIDMVFGPLANRSAGLSFAVHVLPIVIFFSALISVLYHLGVMQLVVRVIGGGIRWLVGTQPVESLCAAANIFVGQTEAPLVVKPYLSKLTQPQVFTIMVSGLASVAGTVLAAYASMGIRVDYLLAASFMAAPGGLLMAKIIMPDGGSEGELASADALEAEGTEHVNVIMAAAVGAQDGVKLAVNIGAMLVAFVSLIAMLNGMLDGVGSWFGIEGLTFEYLMGVVFAPLMYLLNIPWEEAQIAGAFFGEKLILNEFVAFFHFGEVADSLSDQTQAIVTFMLCGFANLSSVAILLGGLGTLMPERKELFARYGLKAVAAGTLSNLMSAAIAGLLFTIS